MKYEVIQEMLERYWEGETSLEEERRIKAYFNSDAVDERLLGLMPLFQAIREEQSLQLVTKAKTARIRPQMYTWAIAASLALLLAAAWWMMRPAKVGLPMAESTPELPQKAIEAVPAVENPKTGQFVSTPGIPKKKKEFKRSKQVRPLDPETAQAMAEIKAALALVSSKLDKGRSEAVKGVILLESVDRVPKKKAG